MRKSKLTLYDCDRCKFTYKKSILRKQRGMFLCDPCFDTTLEIEPFNARFLSPRFNATSIVAVTSPIIFPISSTGITTLMNSQLYTRDGPSNSYIMYIVGIPGISSITDDDSDLVTDDSGNFISDDDGNPGNTGATVITANPQIVAGRQGTLLTLIGTSDVNYVTIQPGRGTDLTTAMVLKNGNTLSLVYSVMYSLWFETSRS